MSKKFQVETYDAYDAPDERTHMLVGEYDSADEALAAAKAVVDGFLFRNRERFTNETDLCNQFSTFGEVPMIFGGPRPDFNPYDYARERAAQIYELARQIENRQPK